MANAYEGHGITVTFGTSGFNMNLIDVTGPSMSRAAIETTHQGTEDWKTFIESALVDGGEVSMNVQYDGAIDPPIDAASETITIAWGSASYAFTGFMTAFEVTGATNGSLQTASCTLKVGGEITMS